MIPGLVDAHTHPVWEGDRVHEFAMKVSLYTHTLSYPQVCKVLNLLVEFQLAGATYMDIHAKGGGIHYTVNCVRQATAEQLYSSLDKRLSTMLCCGSTLVEAKSGYGLDLESELKMLRVIERAKREHTVSVSSTYCGAHAVPK